MSVVTFWVLNCIIYSTISIQNVSFTTSISTLPSAVFSHIAAINPTLPSSLYLIGGYQQQNTNITASNNLYVSNAISIINDNITFNIDQYSLPPFWHHPIVCDHKCDVTINELLYIVQHDGRYPFMLIYNMSNNSFIESNPSSIYPNDISMSIIEDHGDSLINGCIVQYDDHIFIFSSVVYQGLYTSNGFAYDIQSDSWDLVMYQLTQERKGMGCAIYSDHVYLFGGESDDSQLEVKFIEKCDLSNYYSAQYRIYCEPVVGSMTYARSYSRIEVTQDKYFMEKTQKQKNKRIYFIIYGGSTVEAKNHIEIFAPDTEQMIQNIPFDTSGLNIDKYSSVFIGHYLLIMGGTNFENESHIMNTIKYIDTSKFFVNDNEPFDYQCKTVYDVIGSGISIDDYLFRNQEFGIIFSVNETYGDPTITINLLGTQLDILLRRWDDITSYEITKWTADNFYTLDVMTNMSIISELTNIDMMYPNSAFWMKWSLDRDENGNALSIPYWRMGFGDIYDKYNFNDFGCRDSVYGAYVCHDIEVFTGDIYDMTIHDSKYTFYTNTCTLNVYIQILNFSIGGHLHFLWDLHEATSLNVPIYIFSDDIMFIDHTVYILENNTCLIYSQNGSYINCDYGIEISGLKQYNILENEYKLYVTSKLNGLQVSQNNPITLSRIVMNVAIIIDIPNGLFPNSELYITANIDDRTNPTQPNGTIIIYFDEDLMLKDNMAKMFIDFYNNNSCIIEYNNVSISCSQPIFIPFSMIFKSVSNNKYLMNVQSNDINLIGEDTFLFSRQIQKLFLNFSKSIFLGERIAINYDVIDDQVYQYTSSITITSPKYGITSIIEMNYNNVNAILSCSIKSLSTNVIESCDSGLIVQTSDISSIGNYINIELSSYDSYLEIYNDSILIEHCPLGQGLIGSNYSSYSCAQCPQNQVGISNSECISCQGINGITCETSSNLLISYNYWINIENQKILSNFCPVGYCCQNINGCNYLKTTTNASLCAENRDSNIPICGDCVEGYSNVFASTKCKICKENNYYLLLIPFLIAFIFVGIFIALDVPEKEEEENIDDKLEIIEIKDGKQAMQISFLKPIIYYFQAISFVTIQTGYTFYLTPITQLFAFDFSVSETVGIANQIDGICFTKNMKSIDKELWGLFLPFCYFISIFIYSIINKLIQKLCKKHILLFDFGSEVIWRIFLINIGI
eukprot:255304_1